ncbi:MAG: glycerophosphodiester phosphodiesterase [Christensenellales bacterium]|jgi:glycerophosphoryl diester phosphodiesterase
MRTKIQAHRGASAYAPENTLAAFQKAIEMGADGVELDVHFSSDGVLVVTHDDTVDRCSNGTGLVAAHTLAELKALDFSNAVPGFAGERIPTLAEVFSLLKSSGVLINIEIKVGGVPYPGIEAACLRLIREMNMEQQVMFSSFNHLTLREIHQAAPGISLGILYMCGMVDPWLYCKYIGADAIHCSWQNLVMPGLVEGCHANGIKVHPWTVDDPKILALAKQAGVDAVITNVPDVARRIFDGAML